MCNNVEDRSRVSHTDRVLWDREGKQIREWLIKSNLRPLQIKVKIVLPIYESHTMPFQWLYHKGSKYYKVQIPELYGSNSKITRFKLILEMKFSSSAANARADLLNMDIREVQTNITTSKSGFETSQLLQRGQPLRSHVWGWHDEFRLLCHLKFQNEIHHFWSLFHSAAGAAADQQTIHFSEINVGQTSLPSAPLLWEQRTWWI